MLKRLVYAGLLLGVLAAIIVSATVGWRPFVGPRTRALTDRTSAVSEARLARGQYLVGAVSGCLACHSDVDTGRGVPSEPAMSGSGKVMAPEGLPWLVAPNLTPDPETGIGTWSDDMLARGIREGVGADGRALFPMMPYPMYRQMSDEDLASVVVYLRSLFPVRNPLPRTTVPFPPGPLINSIPEPLETPVEDLDLRDPVRRGEYLATLAACADCHTPMDDRNERIAGLEFGGGFVLRDGAGPVASSNLTPDASGIPYYTEELFVDTMRMGRVVTRQLNDIMPWWIYQHMTDDDLRAIFAYLQTLAPVRHRVDNTEEPTLCAVCGLEHGAGEGNTPGP